MKPRFKVRISFNECKGCGRCISACPRGVLGMGKKLNILGFSAAEPVKNDCIGCGICFYTCPEPGAVTIIREIENEP